MERGGWLVRPTLVNRSGATVTVDVTGFADRKAQAVQVTRSGISQVTLPTSGTVSLPAMSLTVMNSPSNGGGMGGTAASGAMGGRSQGAEGGGMGNEGGQEGGSRWHCG